MSLASDQLLLEKVARRKRYQSSLWDLMTEIGGIRVVEGLIGPKDPVPTLSIAFHKPILDNWDRMRRLRSKGKGKHLLTLLSREFCKTTALKWQTIQDYLCNPQETVVWWHAVEEKAEESCYWISSELQHNKELRRLFPAGSLPSEKAKKFISGKQFDLPANKSSHSSSFRAYGWSSEATGGHCSRGKLDDIIARSTIEDNLLPKVERWYQNTVCNVVQANGWMDAIGTRWDLNDQYAKWMRSDYWQFTLRAALEKDGRPSKDGEPTFMDMPLLKRKMDEMGPDFDPQMQNDPSPPGEKPWKAECERFMPKKEAEAARGYVVVITDPAPATVGSFGQAISMGRDSGGIKDEWATCVLKLRRVGDRREIILLDGDSSKDWSVDDGFERMARLAYRYRARAAAIENVGQAIATYEKEWDLARRKNGVSCRRVDLETTYRGKNARFAILSSRAAAGEFFISEGCSKNFLDSFLDQARTWRPLPGGRNGLRQDGCADVTSYGCDSGLANLYEDVPIDTEAWSPFHVPEKESHLYQSRYFAW